MKKKQLSFWQIWNLSFGFLGVQFGFALQNANASRILTSLGADPHSLSYFWLVAPIMGLVVQPIVGAASDKTWTRLGRRMPYILIGAVVSMCAMFLMPNAPFIVKAGGAGALAFGVIMLALMDGSFNVTFQPFRALVADMTPEDQRNIGYSIQSFLINTGAVIGSALPFLLTIFGVSNEASSGEVAPSVIWSFYLGGALLLLSVLVTVFKTKEYPPEEFKAFNESEAVEAAEDEKTNFWHLLKNMPFTMKQLSLTQLLSWFSLFVLWVYSTTAISQHYFGVPINFNPAESSDQSIIDAYNEAGNWVGICFAVYSFVAAIFSIMMPKLIKMTSRKIVYAASLFLGGLGFVSMNFFSDQYMLLFSMIGIGIAWASILAMPYAILSESIPAKKMGVYMGIFNLTVVVPQIFSGVFGGLILEGWFKGDGMSIIIFAGVVMMLGAISVQFIKTNKQ